MLLWISFFHWLNEKNKPTWRRLVVTFVCGEKFWLLHGCSMKGFFLISMFDKVLCTFGRHFSLYNFPKQNSYEFRNVTLNSCFLFRDYTPFFATWQRNVYDKHTTRILPHKRFSYLVAPRHLERPVRKCSERCSREVNKIAFIYGSAQTSHAVWKEGRKTEALRGVFYKWKGLYYAEKSFCRLLNRRIEGRFQLLHRKIFDDACML